VIPVKFAGTIEELRAKVASAGIAGTWKEDQAQSKFMFTSRNKGVLNWWPATQTLNFQGQAVAKATLQAIFFEVEEVASPVQNSPAAASGGRPAIRQGRQIFIVHGHDADARDQLELVLRRVGLEPYILINQSGGTLTLIQALEGKIGRESSSDFGIVLMTPDDVGYAKTAGPEKAEPRARQNVILEAGMLLASLTRRRMSFVVKGHLEIPSDLDGIIRFHYNEHVREVVPKLCQRLQEAGFELLPQQIAAAAQ
jgi:predicted nucleotide-binding protein